MSCLRPRVRFFLYAAAVLSVVLTLLLASPAAAQEWRVVEDDDWCERDRGNRICEVREITLPADRDVIDVSCVNGSITVEGWDRDEIYIKAKISAKGKSERDARDLLEEIEIQTSPRIRAEGPDVKWFSFLRGRNWSVSFRLMVPRESNLCARSTNGSVKVSEVEGEIVCGTTNGSVDLDRVGGDVSAGTVNGGIKVELGGDTWDGRGLDLHTTNGGISVRMPSDYSAVLKAKTTNGGIHVEHPVRIESRSRRKLEAVLGDGGPVISMRTVNGGVKIRETD